MMRRVFRAKYFSRWMKKTDLSDSDLCDAVSEMERGLIDASLGGNLFKKRVALPGRGKSGSTRVLVATSARNRWFFIFGFEKNGRDNVTDGELIGLKGYAERLLTLPDVSLKTMLESQALVEICRG